MSEVGIEPLTFASAAKPDEPFSRRENNSRESAYQDPRVSREKKNNTSTIKLIYRLETKKINDG
jgi:hypothetical protein